jgi:serine/threonine-protein kinase
MMRELGPGTLIDNRYRVISRIGSGGMADVFCAEDSQLGRRVAVKVLHQRFAEDAEFVERFRREASSAAALSHPNVVAVFDRGEWEGSYYIAMEYLPGRSLKELIREQGALAPLSAIDITSQVLEAARFAHRRGVVHRDIKPLNVIVDDEGRVKVTDFGIARAGASEITQTGSILGTAQYLSPEQAQGHAVGPQSDLYAIGILLYELLTGHVPFDAESVVAIALKQVGETAPVPSSVNPMVTPELDAIVARALAKDPAARYADADEFLAALDAERTRLIATPEPQTQSLAAAAAAYQAAQTTYLPEQEDGDQGEPGPAAPRRPVWPWVLGAVLLVAGIAVVVVLLAAPSKQAVPNVVGQQVTTATTLLQDAGFSAVPVEVANSATQGTVLAQSPAGGQSAARGTVVQLTVSNGPGNKQIPDVGGQTESAATSALKKAGFQVASTQAASATVPQGSVISTTPAALSIAPAGSTVQLNVSSGPRQVVVPNVGGRTQADATGILEGAGFTVSTVSQQSSQTAGTVLSQSPSAGSDAAAGSTVVLTIAAPPATVTVPLVVGQTLANARSTLQGDNLGETSTTQAVTDQAQDGVVLSQDPAGGKSVKPGTQVKLVVGTYTVSPTGASGPTGAT